ncbi:hypothetical protein GPX89_01935 [Nocardia sp. ET3-3]|uniref:Uncharacterized protein n=1 Tax=Nocardia terrae TaxID=2675851 RepID=A0A7K1UNV2_9NOCA|nr:hypothetical protein [Nocardia terrae]MVU76001.1 hypothetical protein [Nocardia terrae]
METPPLIAGMCKGVAAFPIPKGIVVAHAEVMPYSEGQPPLPIGEAGDEGIMLDGHVTSSCKFEDPFTAGLAIWVRPESGAVSGIHRMEEGNPTKKPTSEPGEIVCAPRHTWDISFEFAFSRS